MSLEHDPERLRWDREESSFAGKLVRWQGARRESRTRPLVGLRRDQIEVSCLAGRLAILLHHRDEGLGELWIELRT